jgi:hypothetical protein
MERLIGQVDVADPGSAPESGMLRRSTSPAKALPTESRTTSMFHADDPEAKNAFGVAAVLKHYGG